MPAVRRKAVAVIGARRAGKTTFLWQVLADRLAAGVPHKGLLYFSFEDERLAGLAATDLAVFREYLRHRGREPQNDPSRFTKAERSAVDRALRDALADGGFPEAQGLAMRDRIKLLRGYVDLAILRDTGTRTRS